MNDNCGLRQLSELCRNVLLVEDSIIIAMDAEALITDIGAGDVTVATSVREALEKLDSSHPTLAILDVKLQGETCFPIADRLQELHIPYVFATGYSDHESFPDRHKLIPCMTKPYNGESLRQVIEDTIGLASVRYPVSAAYGLI